MNSFRPRTLLLNQTFQCISSLEEFSRIDNSALSESSLNQSQYHPHHPLHTKANENNSSTPSKASCFDAAPKPKQIIEHHNEIMDPFIEKKIQIQGYSYVRLHHDRILPRDDAYELREEDLDFLKLFNKEKIENTSSKGEISEELLKQFFIHFETKSTRQTTATKEESLIDMPDELKEAIEAADLYVLYQYWKRERENDKYLRQGELITQKEIYPFMRKYWRANSEEQAYHATFRPREYCRKKTRKSTRTDNKEIQDKLLGLEADFKKCRQIALKLKKRELLKRELAFQEIDDFSISVPGLAKEFKIFNTFNSRAADIAALQGQISPKMHKHNKLKQTKLKQASQEKPNSENIITLPLISNNNIPKESIQAKVQASNDEAIKVVKSRIKKSNKIGDDDASKGQQAEETKGFADIPNVEKKKETKVKQRKQTEVVDQQNETSALMTNQDALTGGIDIKQETAQLEKDTQQKNGVQSNETAGNKRRQKKISQGINKEKKEEVMSEINSLQKKEEGQVQQMKENIIIDQVNKDASKSQEKQQKQQLLQGKQEQVEERDKLRLDTQQEQTSFLTNFLMYFSSLGIPVTVENVQDSEKVKTKSQAIQEEKQQKLKNQNTLAYLIRSRVARAGRVFLDRVCDNPTDVAGIQSGKISYFIEPTTKKIIYNTFSYPNPEAIRVIKQQPSEQQQPSLSYQQQQQSPSATSTTAASTTANSTQISQSSNLKMSEEEFLLNGPSVHNQVKNDPKEKEFFGGVTVSDRSKEKERDLFRNCIAFEAKNQRIQTLIEKQQKAMFSKFPRNQKAIFSSKNRKNKNNSYLRQFVEDQDDSETSFQSAQQGNNPFQNLRQKVQLRVKEREKLKQQQIQKEKAEQQRQARLQQQKESKQQLQQKDSLFPLNQVKFNNIQSQNGDINTSLQNPFILQPQRLDNADFLLNENSQMISEQLGDNQFSQSEIFYQNNPNQFNPYNAMNSTFKPETPPLQSFNSQNLQQYGVNQLLPQDSNNFNNFDNLPNHNNASNNMFLPTNSIMQSPSRNPYFSPSHNANNPYDNFANQQRDLNNPYDNLSSNMPIQDNLQNANHSNHNYGYFADLDQGNLNIINPSNIPYDSTQIQNNIPLNNNNSNEQIGQNDGFEQDYLNCDENQPDQFLDEIENAVNFNQNAANFNQNDNF